MFKVLLAFLLFFPFLLHAATELESWRTQVTQTRLLAENNVPLAYKQAKQLQANPPINAEPSDTVRALNLLARIEIYLAQTEQADKDARLALNLATQHADREGMAEAELNISLNSVNEANIDELKRSTLHSLELLKDVRRPDLLAESMLRTAVMYRRFGQINESVKMSMQAMEVAGHSTNPLVLIYAHQGLAISFDQSDHVKEAYEQFRQMRIQAHAGGQKLQEAYALTGLAGITAKLGDSKNGEALAREAMALFREVGTPYGIAHSLHELASLLQLQGRYKEAQQYLDEIVSIFQQHPHKIGLWYTLNTRSKNYQILGNTAAAQADAENAYKLAREIGLPIYLSESAQHMANLAAAKGDYKRAFTLSSEATEMSAKAAREKINAEVVTLMQSYESESKKRQIDELTRRNEQQAAEIRQRQLQQRWLWTVLGGSIVMLASTAFFLLRLRRSHRMQEAVNRQLHQSQSQLEKQTDILQSILDSMGDGVAVANEHGKLLLVNPAGEKILGIGLTESDPSHWSRQYGLYLPDQVTPYPTAEVPLVRAIHGESCDGVEMFVRNTMLTEGRWLSVTARPLTDKNGVTHGGVVVFSDITARKRTEEEILTLNTNLEQNIQARTAELRQQTRYLRTLIDLLPILAWFKDTQSRFLVVNQATANAGGRTVEDMIGKTDLDFWPRDQADAFRADDKEVMATRQRKTVQEQLTDADKVIWIETYKAPVLDEDGTVLGTVGAARDISAQKATETAREAALHEAQRLARLRSEFLAQMSHELRTPLNGILGYAQILLRDKTLDEGQISRLGVIQKSGEHLLTLINDILDFAKIEANKMELYPNDIALGRFLRVICEMISIKATQKNLEFNYDPAPDLPQVIHADEKRLRQVLLNLLANAVKFTDHGQINFRVSFKSPSLLHFEVEDTGIGIADNQLESIFQPFEQAGEIQRRMGGTGLGLAISQQFVHLMHGDIKVESRLGSGSKFWFDIEVTAMGAFSFLLPIDRTVTGYTGNRKTILVVDDLAENRKIIGDMLQPLGFNLVEAEDGREGMEKAKAVRPDIILMDIIMPELDGIEATRRIRQDATLRDLPVIAISASVSDSDEVKCLEAGMNAFMPKPVDMDKLLAQIALLLQIEWIYEVTTATSQPLPGPLEIPPQPEIETLHRLALMGNMRDIQQQAAHLIGLDERYRAFAEQLNRLAQGYQSKAILNLVEQYLERKPAL